MFIYRTMSYLYDELPVVHASGDALLLGDLHGLHARGLLRGTRLRERYNWAENDTNGTVVALAHNCR